MIRKIFIALVAAVGVSQAYAQDVAFEPLPINNAGPRLTPELLEAEKGGAARVAFTVTVTGDVKDVELLSSSGAAAFDELAVNAVKKWTFSPARDAANAAVEVRRAVPIGFRTEAEVQAGIANHLSSQLSQPCSQFISDVAAAKATEPQELSKAVGSFRELWGQAFGSLLVSGDKPKVLVAMVEAEGVVFNNVVAGCSSNPESTLGDQFKASLQHQLSVARSES